VPDEMRLSVITAVAAGNLLIRIEAALPSDADPQLIDGVEAIGRSAVFTTRGNPGQVQQELQELRQFRRTPNPKSSLFTPSPAGRPSSSETGLTPLPDAGGDLDAQVAGGPGAIQRVLTTEAQGNGEVEVIASTNGQTIVIARQGSFRISVDGGQNFLPP